MKTRKTIYHIIVDKSGSMNDCVDSTINGFNEQINSIKSKQLQFADEEMTIGLTTFSHEIKHHYCSLHPNLAIPLNVETYVPDGYTALYDAIGLTVESIEKDLRNASLAIPTTIVIVILTDGYENASKIYNLVKIRNLISRLEESKHWTFSFIGATLDAVEVATAMSIKSQNSFQFQKEEMNSSVWKKLDSSLSHYFTKKQDNRDLDNFFEE